MPRIRRWRPASRCRSFHNTEHRHVLWSLVTIRGRYSTRHRLEHSQRKFEHRWEPVRDQLVFLLSPAVVLGQLAYHLFLLEDNVDTTFVWVKFDRIGFHHFPAAKTDKRFEDVSYLGAVHRHKFFFLVKIEVFHDDREIEFHQLLNRLTGHMDRVPDNYDHKSCEMLAKQVADLLNEWYPGRALIVEVSEDNECGAILIRQSKPEEQIERMIMELVANDEIKDHKAAG